MTIKGMTITIRKAAALLLAFTLLCLSACSQGSGHGLGEQETASPTDAIVSAADADPGKNTPVEKTGDIMILFTSDVHCGVDQGFGYAGLAQIRSELEAQGYETLLVDNGDSVQGETIGVLTNGEADIELMNAMRYDAAIPGNHEFDYGMERFFRLTEMADFPYISCNFTYKEERVFEPYIILEAAGRKIAFVGVTTPTTLASSTPAFFQNDAGEFIYGFMQDDTGEGVYAAVQGAVDDARAEGAELVYVMAHLGMAQDDAPWTYADVIANTTGIDVFLDGHSHDSEQVVMKNKDGYDVVRSACGTKLSGIGYSHINPDGTIADTGIWSWPNKTPMPVLLGIDNDMNRLVADEKEQVEASLRNIIAHTDHELTINDPEAVDLSGNPVRMIRRAETNLGDLVADAVKERTDADIAMVGGGGIRVSITKGDISLGDVLNVLPFGNRVCKIEATGQQILDALEWGARAIPGETGAFMHVSGMTYEIHSYIKSGCVTDANSMQAGINGKRRVQNVMINGQPVDPEKTYIVSGFNYSLINNGDGLTAFDGAKVLDADMGIDYETIAWYLSDGLGGEVSDMYADPLGQERIVIIE